MINRFILSGFKYTLFLFPLLILFLSCSKEAKTDCENPIDCLPPATQNGAQTAGCMVDGKILLPGKEKFGSLSRLQVQYVYYKDEYLFGLIINSLNNEDKSVGIELRNQVLKEGETYLLTRASENTGAGFFMRSGFGYGTSEIHTGELYISHLDHENFIVSGTFWFDAENEFGEIVEVREGRFDVYYVSVGIPGD